jgi:tyrosinase-like protein
VEKTSNFLLLFALSNMILYFPSIGSADFVESSQIINTGLDDSQLFSPVSTTNHSDSKLLSDLKEVNPDAFLLSKGSFRADYEGPLLGGELSPIIVFSDNIKNNSGLLDFGKVPAVTPPKHMKFMPPFETTFYVTNVADSNISISSIQLSDIRSPQASPFNFCGVDYNSTSIHLAPGYSQTLLVCFYPNKAGPSNATIQFFDGPNILATIPITGNGITPTDNMLMATEGDHNFSSQNIRKSEDILELNKSEMLSNTLEGSNDSSILENSATACSVKIEGGGARPNPKVNGEGPSNTTSESPPDDGLNLDDVPENHLHKINVGEFVDLSANIYGVLPQNIQNIKWIINEPKIRDYDESLPGKFVTSNLTMRDYEKPNISFYWTDTGNKNVTIVVQAKIGNQSMACGDSRTFVVERNIDDVNRQAEDFYIFNHNARVLHDHFNWHTSTNPINSICEPRISGAEFFTFHKGIISNFDNWRQTFGYKNISAWDPGTALPLETEYVDTNRIYPYRPQLTPSFFTPEGGKTASACSAPALEDSQPENGNNPLYSYTIRKLTDFINATDLANELEPTWHGTIHTRIGGLTPDESQWGDMSDFALAPKDPMFWRWHKYIDQIIYDKYVQLNGSEKQK